MENASIEYALSRFALTKFGRDALALHQLYFDRIQHNLRTIGSQGSLTISTQDQADAYALKPTWSDSQHRNLDLLDEATIAALVSVYRDFIEIFATTDDKNYSQHLLTMARALWPLFSRHSLTEPLGFNLQEYVDIFLSAHPDERQTLRVQLLSEST